MTHARLPIELKAFYRDLVTACGGPKRAAEITGGQPSHISEAMAPHHPQPWPRIDHVAMLEAECGQPIVTAALADRLGYAIAAVTAPGGQRAPLSRLSHIVSEVRDVEVGILNAMSDGHITAGERRDIRKEAQQAIAALNALCADLADPAAPGVVGIVKTGAA